MADTLGNIKRLIDGSINNKSNDRSSIGNGFNRRKTFMELIFSRENSIYFINNRWHCDSNDVFSCTFNENI
jgi:hypothetical protein